VEEEMKKPYNVASKNCKHFVFDFLSAVFDSPMMGKAATGIAASAFGTELPCLWSSWSSLPYSPPLPPQRKFSRMMMLQTATMLVYSVEHRAPS